MASKIDNVEAAPVPPTPDPPAAPKSAKPIAVPNGVVRPPPVRAPPPPPPRDGTIERHFYDRAKEKNPVELWKHNAAKAMKRWPIGAEVNRDEYDAAITNAENITLS